jgi:hypothetical protein
VTDRAVIEMMMIQSQQSIVPGTFTASWIRDSIEVSKRVMIIELCSSRLAARGIE